jgi:hypothetical protein
MIYQEKKRCSNIFIVFIVAPCMLLQLLFVPTHALTHFNPLNAELDPICHLLALGGAHHILHVSRIRVKTLTHVNI